MALTIAQRNEVVKMLIEGEPRRQIAERFRVSERTFSRIKSKIPESRLRKSDDSGMLDDDTMIDALSLYTISEKKYTRKIDKTAYLYEDVEEGWTYHVEKENHILKTHGLWWSFIVYPESSPKDWIERLARTGLAIAISPLHDKDKWNHDSPRVVNPDTGEIIEKGARYKAGDPKKPHWHVLVICGTSTGYVEINNLVREITQGPYGQKCRSLKLQYDYFTHETDEAQKAGKYVYDKSEIQRFNNFHIVPNKYEVGVLQCEVIKDIKAQGFTEMREVMDYYQDQPEMMNLIWSKPGIVMSYLHSLWKTAHPESSVKLVRTINKSEYEEIIGRKTK